MAMSHADCDHPRTPAGRASCRRRAILADRDGNAARVAPPTPHDEMEAARLTGTLGFLVTPEQVAEDRRQQEAVRATDAGQPRRARKARGADTRDPVQRLRDHQKALLAHPSTVKRLKARTGDLKRPGTRLRTIGDLPDVPRMLAHGCRIAWDHDWEVKVGHQFNDDEKRIVIDGDVCEVSLVWKPSLPDGVWGVFVRKTSITHRIDAGVEHAMRIAAGEEPFEW